jgi:2,4-dienoyl-CoA reductase-like NADH-dependent reductase (Old Yellow Enzyme family)
MSSDALLRPFKLKGLNLPNRVVMAPMTRSFSPGGIPTEDVARYYRRRAEGAVGSSYRRVQAWIVRHP